MGKILTEDVAGAPPLAGTAGNPAHEPKRAEKEGKGSVGDVALMDAVAIIVIAWVLLIALWFSLRHHNV